MTDKKGNKKDVPSVDTGATLGMDVKDRLFIGGFFPKEANKLELILARDITKKTELTQKDIVDFKVAFDGKTKQTTWSEEGQKKKKIRFSNPEVEFLQRQTKRLDSEKKLTLELLSLCERIDSLNKKTDEQEE